MALDTIKNKFHSVPEYRAQRKQYEKEHPHFNMTDFGLKAGCILAVGTLLLFPLEKHLEKHQAEEHPERLEKGRGAVERRRKGVERAERESMRSDGGRRRRSVEGRGKRIEEGGRRERKMVPERGPERAAERLSERGYLPHNWMKSAIVADGFSYMSDDTSYLESSRNPRREEREVYTDDYQFRPLRDDRRRR